MKVSPQKREFLREYFEEYASIDLSSEDLHYCCGVKEIGEFPEDKDLDIDDSELDEMNVDWKDAGKTKRSDITEEELEEELQQWLNEALESQISEDQNSEGYPFMVTLLTKEQSRCVKYFKKLQENKPDVIITQCNSGSSGNDLTVIFVP